MTKEKTLEDLFHDTLKDLLRGKKDPESPSEDGPRRFIA